MLESSPRMQIFPAPGNGACTVTDESGVKAARPKCRQGAKRSDCWLSRAFAAPPCAMGTRQALLIYPYFPVVLRPHLDPAIGAISHQVGRGCPQGWHYRFRLFFIAAIRLSPLGQIQQFGLKLHLPDARLPAPRSTAGTSPSSSVSATVAAGVGRCRAARACCPERACLARYHARPAPAAPRSGRKPVPAACNVRARDGLRFRAPV